MTGASSAVPDPRGVRTLVANLGVKDDTTDFALIVADEGTTAAGLYTRSRFAGPSVELSRAVTASGRARAVVVVSKNANVANGEGGRIDAAELQSLAARLAGVDPAEVVVASTGVIGRPYPMDRMREGIGTLAAPTTCDLDAVAEAIMTTDTHPKVARRAIAGSDAVVVGVAKGVGMIEPDMATLLTFVVTDASVAADELDAAFRRVVGRTFNALSIDSDTSTSDSAVVLATGAAGPVDASAFEAALGEVALELTLMIAADGEGATKVIEVVVTGARGDDQARRAAKSIVNSPLVKTAVHGADPNWGRVAMAVGKLSDDRDIDPERVTIAIGGVTLFEAGMPRSDAATLDAASAAMGAERVRIEVDLAIATGAFTAYGCDLTDGYIRINADYTT